MKTEKGLQDFLFEKNHDAFSIAAAVQCAFRLLEKDTMFIADAVKVHLQHEILEFAKAYAQQRVEEATRWIPVSERLPEFNSLCLAFGVGHTPVMCRYTRRFERHIDRVDNDRTLAIYYDKITHWQPLPKAPTV